VAREEEDIKIKIKILSRIEVPAETVKLVNLEVKPKAAQGAEPEELASRIKTRNADAGDGHRDD
jgi:hypothetical protein